MSLQKELGENYKNLNKVLLPYIEALDDKDAHIRIKGKTLEEANREQASWQSFYDERRIEVSTYVKFFEQELKRVRGKLFKNYVEKYTRDLSDRQIDKYIDNENAYLKVYENYITVRELYELYNSVVESFKSRGFALRNLTEIYVHSLTDVIL